MTAIALLKKAIEYDMNGRRMESLKLYEDGIEELMKVCKCKDNQSNPGEYFQNCQNLPSLAETNEEKKTHYKTKILDYMQRAEEVKESIKQMTTRGEIKDKIHIMDGATGYSYKRIFEKYCTADVREILIEEPYLKDFYQVSLTAKEEIPFY